MKSEPIMKRTKIEIITFSMQYFLELQVIEQNCEGIDYRMRKMSLHSNKCMQAHTCTVYTAR